METQLVPPTGNCKVKKQNKNKHRARNKILDHFNAQLCHTKAHIYHTQFS